MDKLGRFSTNLPPNDQNRFFYFYVLLKALGCLETCVNCVTNWVTPKRVLARLLYDQMNLDETTWPLSYFSFSRWLMETDALRWWTKLVATLNHQFWPAELIGGHLGWDVITIFPRVDIVFHTDYAIGKRGFSIKWKAVDPINPTIKQPNGQYQINKLAHCCSKFKGLGDIVSYQRS